MAEPPRGRASPRAILAVVGFGVFIAADDLTVVSTMLRPIIAIEATASAATALIATAAVVPAVTVVATSAPVMAMAVTAPCPAERAV